MLLLERIFHLLPFQSSIPGERVVSERLQAGTTFIRDCSGQARVPVSAGSCPCTTLLPGHTAGHLSPKGITFLPGSARSCPHGPAQNSPSARNVSYSSTTTGDCLPACQALRKFLAEHKQVKPRASQCKLQSQNEALMPSTQRKQRFWFLLQKNFPPEACSTLSKKQMELYSPLAHARTQKQGTLAPGREKPAWTHQSRSTRPPCLAMADFTRLANCTASSSGCGKIRLLSRSKGPKQERDQIGRVHLTCLVIGGKYQTLQTMAQLVIILRR